MTDRGSVHTLAKACSRADLTKTVIGGSLSCQKSENEAKLKSFLRWRRPTQQERPSSCNRLSDRRLCRLLIAQVTPQSWSLFSRKYSL
jgi:hypothetical protein